jgi:SpoVK/Ycf46/Vps4 family AAA+-type ATPase
MASPTRDSDMPRISVDTLKDWERVRDTFTEAMIKLLEDKLAQEGCSEADKEALRAHALEVRDRTFEAAKPNLRVNGRNFEDHVEEEPGMVARLKLPYQG